MALPTTPPITSEMIRLEYGGSLPFNIRNYFRGGGLVPNNAANSGVPTSGTIQFYNFLGQNSGGGGDPGVPLSAGNSGAAGYIFRNEPAPSTSSVSASGNVFVSGGSGSYTCTWAHISGSTSIPTPGANVFNPSFSATVSKNTVLTAVKRCTVSDGVNTPVSTDMNVRLEYATDA